ncbi:MAG: rhomboid family intramembrane serine protease [Sediminicola sp.]|tara:strand:+ start:103654 stop:104400 length:747 start_codon:yes stop_codon:yes gene_type:complete
MQEERYFTYSNWVLIVPMVTVLLIWSIFWAELSLGLNLNAYGIEPRTFLGLRGIVFGPFIHGSISHLYHNTIPIALLLAALVQFYRESALKVLFWGTLFAGFVTWAIGRPSHHIGISGVIYLLASFIFFKGILTKHYRLVALSLVVVFIYGGLLWYMFPIEEGISWEGHLSGFVVGILLAFTVKGGSPPKPKFDWERDDFREEEDVFLRHFDSEGNFIGNGDPIPPSDGETKIVYHYRETQKGDEEAG